MNPASTGKILEHSWVSMVDFVHGISIEEFAIMPNHFHGIITFLHKPTLRANGKKIDLSKIIRMFKARSKRLNDKAIKTIVEDRFIVHENRLYAPYQWQKSFYDHIIRNEQDYARIQNYIINKPARWKIDLFHPKNEEKYQKWINANKS